MTQFADQRRMQDKLFSKLSTMFGQEVPLYDKSLIINSICNRTICDLLSQLFSGFNMTAEQIEKTSGERHGAIRIGKPSEYRWIARLFAVFAMEPHNFYDMTTVGAKSQPIVATAFRSRLNPDHRVFSSLLMTDYFAPETRARIEELIATREVFSVTAKELICKHEQQNGLSWDDADALIGECVDRIFKWTGQARDYQLYSELCNAGFKIAADIACFSSHHLNHLTPNTFCIDLYTTAMKFGLGELDDVRFKEGATETLTNLAASADRDYLQLHFKELTRAEIDLYQAKTVADTCIDKLVAQLCARLQQDDLDLSRLNHSGFKDHTEGPAVGVPVLLRQDAYKALSEPVRFQNSDGTVVDTVHTARFGEIEQRLYATTQKGRKLYDRCLAEVDALKQNSPARTYHDIQAQAFAPFPHQLRDLLRQGLVYGIFSATKQGIAARGKLTTTDIHKLVRSGHVDVEGLRYEDFLPVSAAGIFASNLNQYGTKSTAAEKPIYNQAMLEQILGRRIVSAGETCAALQAKSLLSVYAQLGLKNRLAQEELEGLEQARKLLLG